MRPFTRSGKSTLVFLAFLAACATAPTGRVTMPLGDQTAHAATQGVDVGT